LKAVAYADVRNLRRGGSMDDKKQRILAIAMDAFDNEATARQWLEEPNIRTGMRPPIELIDTAEGFHAIEIILNQVKYGVFA
jgi:putative toxin-antitoxin system antitoxin component (TIGR02293 family)